MTRRELPTAVYAVAGAGELAYRRLRKLPEAATRTIQAAGRTADALRERGEPLAYRQRLNTDLAKLRESAQRGTATVLTRAAEVQERAASGYRQLVAHGETVLADRAGDGESPVVAVATVETEPAPADRDPDGAEATPDRSSGTS